MWGYAIPLLVLLVVVVLLYVRAQFWVRQPVRCWWKPRKQTVHGVPPVKYLDHANVVSSVYDGSCMTELVAYLQTQTNGVYFPNADHFSAYFVGAYISTYGKDVIQGCIVSRPIELYIDRTAYRAFYHENMTSEKDDVSRRLISTHGTNLAKNYPNAPVVFSTTYPLIFVMPVVHYDVCWVQTRVFKKYSLPFVSYLKITDQNVHVAVEWWKKHRFEYQVNPTIVQLVSWIQSKTASIYFVIQGNVMLGSFYFKNTWMVEKNKCVMDCCGAIFPHDRTLMYKSFSTLLYRARRANPIVRLHNVSDLTYLPPVAHFKKTAFYYYLYRYMGPSNVAPKDCFVY